MFATFKQIFKKTNKDLKNRILYTIGALFIFALGNAITVPGMKAITSDLGFLELLNAMSGGGLKQFSIFALGVMPYITASILLQVLQMDLMGITYFQELKEMGEEGRRKINKINRYLGIGFALIEGYIYSIMFMGKTGTPLEYVEISIILTAGTAFLLYLGDQITNKGLGNGISLIIMAGIVNTIPSMMIKAFNELAINGSNTFIGIISFIIFVLLYIAIIVGVVYVQEAERRIPVQYAKKVVGRKMVGAQNTHIPLKLAMAGVMPVIFASSLLTFPAMIIQLFAPNIQEQTGFWSVIYKFSIATSTSANIPVGYTIANAIVYLLLILGFTFFYTYVTFNPVEVSNNIKRNGGFIPGIRAGKPTTEYLQAVMSKLLWFGGLFLAVIAVLPMLTRFVPNIDLTFGGTSILIVVGVALETIQQLESYLVMRHYKGFLE